MAREQAQNLEARGHHTCKTRKKGGKERKGKGRKGKKGGIKREKREYKGVKRKEENRQN